MKRCGDEFWGDSGPLRSKLVGCCGVGPAGHDSTHAVMVDVGSADHHRPVVGIDVDRRTLIEAPPLVRCEFALTAEVTTFNRAQLPGKKPGAFGLSEGFSPITHKAGTGGQEKAARYSREEYDGFHRIYRQCIWLLLRTAAYIL